MAEKTIEELVQAVETAQAVLAETIRENSKGEITNFHQMVKEVLFT